MNRPEMLSLRDECEHGARRRVCPVCERDQDLAEAALLIDGLTRRLAASGNVIARLEAENATLRSQLIEAGRILGAPGPVTD